MGFEKHPSFRWWGVGWVLLAAVTAGCRTMPAEDRPFTHTRTYYAATEIDPEPHVLNVTVHAPSRPLDYGSPRRLGLSLLRGTLYQNLDNLTTKAAHRTRGAHSVGHVMIELKSTDPVTGTTRYLLTAVTMSDPDESVRQIVGDKIGFSFFVTPVGGRTETYDKVATDLDESGELGISSARLRVLLTPEAADRVFRFYAEFLARGGERQFVLVSDPLTGDGVSCASLAASFLRVADSLPPEWQAAWRRTLHVPESLLGDPTAGKKVPIRRMLVGPAARRWAEPDEPHRDIEFYDTTKVYEWVVRHARLPAGCLPPGVSNRTPVECRLESLLGVPVVTVDRR